MKTLYVHIGTMKTGSTAIQIFLNRNKEYLNKNNFAYPDRTFAYPEKPARRNGMFLAISADPNGIVDEKFDEEIVNQQIAKIEEGFLKYDNVILSEETAWQHITADRSPVWEKLTSHFIEQGITIKVIVYLRRQDIFIESYWKQAVKHSRYKWTFEYCLEKYPEKIKLDYLSNLDDIAASVGEENICVRRYQREDLIDGDVVIDFLTTVGLPTEEVREEILQTEIKNSSITNNVAWIAKELNSLPNLTKEESRRWKPYLRAVSELEAKRKTKYSMLSTEEAVEFVKLYGKNNDKLADKYIGDGESLFNDIYDNGIKWSRDNPNYITDVIRVLGASINDLLDKIEEQDRRIKELEKTNLIYLLKKCGRGNTSI